MTLKQEQEKIQKAINASLSGLQTDPWLSQRVLALAKGEKRKVKKKISVSVILVITVLSIACAALAATNWVGIGEFLGKIVGGWEVKRDAIVQPISQHCTSEMLSFTATEAYWAEDGLSLVVKVDAKSDHEIPVYAFEEGLLDDEGEIRNEITVDGQTISLDQGRDGREIILCNISPVDEGWNWYKRTEEGLFLIVTSWNMDAKLLSEGTTLNLECTSQNIQTEITDYNGILTVQLPPMTMQQGHK